MAATMSILFMSCYAPLMVFGGPPATGTPIRVHTTIYSSKDTPSGGKKLVPLNTGSKAKLKIEVSLFQDPGGDIPLLDETTGQPWKEQVFLTVLNNALASPFVPESGLFVQIGPIKDGSYDLTLGVTKPLPALAGEAPVFFTTRVTNLKNPIVTYEPSPPQLLGLSGVLAQQHAVKGRILQQVVVQDPEFKQTAQLIPYDDTVPQITEGDLAVQASFSPKRADSVIDIQCTVYVAMITTGHMATALFRDSLPGALAVAAEHSAAANRPEELTLLHVEPSGSTNERTYSIRFGSAEGSTTLNGISTGRQYGGALKTTLRITEYSIE